MKTNYFEDLWRKAKRLGVTKYQIGKAMFPDYHSIYRQGRVSKLMQKRHAEIDAVIDELAKKGKK